MTGDVDAQAPGTDLSDYNRMFEILVDDNPEDESMVLSFVAYAYYKLAKREWVKRFCERAGRRPNDEEMNAYISTWTPTRIDGLKTEAKQSMSVFAEYIVEAHRPQIVEDALKHQSFFREASVAFVGALVYTLFLIFIALLAKFAHIDLFAIIQAVAVGGAH